MSGSRNKFTHFLRAGGPREVAAIDKFIELIRPQLRGGVWFLDPISFLAWCYNLESLHEPVAVFEDSGSAQIRTILGLDAFQRQGCAPSAKVQHCRIVTTDSTTPTADLSTLLTEQDTQCVETTESVSRDPVNLQGSLDDRRSRGATTHGRLLRAESPRSSTSDNVHASEMNCVGRVQLPSPISQTMSQAVFNGTAGNPGYGTTYNEGAPPQAPLLNDQQSWERDAQSSETTNPPGAIEPENALPFPVSQMVAASQSRGNRPLGDQELSMWGSSVPQPSRDRSPDASSSRNAPSDECADFSTQVLLPMEEVWKNLGGLENVAPVDLEGMLFTPADYERLGSTANAPTDPCFNQRAE